MSASKLLCDSALLYDSPLRIGSVWELEAFACDASERRQYMERIFTIRAEREFKKHLELTKSPCSSCDHAKISTKTISAQEKQKTTVSMNCELGSRPVCPHDMPRIMPACVGLPDYLLPKKNKDAPQSVSSNVW